MLALAAPQKTEIVNEASAATGELTPTISSILDSLDGNGYLPLLLGGNYPDTRVLSRNVAFTFGPVYRCAALIAGTLASLPLYVEGPDGMMVDLEMSKSKSKGAQRAKQMLRLFQGSPNMRDDCFNWMETVGLDIALDGNAYLILMKDRFGNIEGLDLASTRYATIELLDDHLRSRVYYLYSEMHDSLKPYPVGEVIHVKAPRMLSRTTTSANIRNLFGISPVMAISYDVRTGIASREYVGEFFRGGVGGAFVITSDQRLNREQRDMVREAVVEHNASRGRAHRPLILGAGMTATAVDTSPQNNNLKELRDQQVEEVSRAYGVPAPLLGINITQWGSGIEHLYRIFLKFSLRHYEARIASALGLYLLDPGWKFKFDETDILRGDTQAIARLWQASDGIMTANEARRYAGLPKRGDGDSVLDRKASGENNPNPMPTPDRDEPE